jgi:TetR/AcrR family fatty acid metabolism transcriptional regulator
MQVQHAAARELDMLERDVMITLSRHDPNFAVIFLKDTKLNKRFYSTKSYSYLHGSLSVLKNVLDEVKSKGVFRADVNNRVFRNLFLGTFSHMTVRWFIVGKVSPIGMMEELNEVTSILCRSVSRELEAPVI